MSVDLVAWLGLALRWLHLITGIAWIGSSFYFIWLDNSLKAPEDKKDEEAGVGGELWAVHGGGFYHKKKYRVAPDHMPEDLHWFKWEAYFTWVSGFLLLCLVYYHGAKLYLIDSNKLDMNVWQATLTGLGFIVGGWIIYDALCKSKIGENNRVFGFVWFAALTAAAYALGEIFTGRGAYIHVGAIIGTVMAANVLMVIIPNQRKVVADLLAGKKPDPKLGIKAKQRSVHNNYMTLPVLLTMISNHYPMLYGHQHGWLVLAGLAAAAWPIRQFFNLKHKGKVDYRYPAAGVAGFVFVMLFASGVFNATVSGAAVSDDQVQAIMKTHCTMCHSARPAHEGFDVPAADLSFEDMAEVRKQATRIYAQVVATDTMPLGNETGMTVEERKMLGDWIKSLEN